MIALQSHGLPLAGHLLGSNGVLLPESAYPFCCHLRVSGDSFDRLDGQVGVMGKMTGEIVGTKLIFRIEPLVFQVVRPFRQLRPILPQPISNCLVQCPARP